MDETPRELTERELKLTKELYQTLSEQDIDNDDFSRETISNLIKDRAFQLQKIDQLERIALSHKNEQDRRKACLEYAQKRVADRGMKEGELQWKWRQYPPPKFNWSECMDAILDALNREGIIAWTGDGTGCVQQIVYNFAKKAEDLEFKIERTRSYNISELLSEEQFGNFIKDGYNLALKLLDEPIF